jgi:hypothetical protein
VTLATLRDGAWFFVLEAGRMKPSRRYVLASLAMLCACAGEEDGRQSDAAAIEALPTEPSGAPAIEAGPPAPDPTPVANGSGGPPATASGSPMPGASVTTPALEPSGVPATPDRSPLVGGQPGGVAGSSPDGVAGEAPVSDPAPVGGSGGTAFEGVAGRGVSGSGGRAPVDAGGIFPEGVTAPRIMIVGDSISAGPGCYKKYLLEQLASNGYSRFEFVGEYDDDCGGGVRHSAVSCTTAGNYTMPTFMVSNCFPDVFPGLATLMSNHNPDLVMIQLGVNDVWGGNTAVDSVLANYTTLVEQARAHNPNVVLVVAQIHKIITDNCSNTASTTNAQQLVEAVPEWAAGLSTGASPVFVADLWTNSDPMEADDCVHPDDAGARRMGQNWFTALAGILPKD